MEKVIIKTRAPLRISFAGGGTDIEPYLSDYGSYVLSAAINLYARAFYPVDDKPILDIEQILTEISGKQAIKILSDAYPMSGMGSSASCFVAGLKAIYSQLNKDQLAQLAFYLERKVMNIRGGIQDQYCAAHGGFLFMIFEENHISIERLNTTDNFNRYLILVYAGKRELSGNEIIKAQLCHYNVKALHRQKQIARLMKDCLAEKRYIEFGNLLNEAWHCKKEQSSIISTSTIDDLYNQCLNLGAIGGTLTGAGAGGYMLLMEHPEKEGELRQNLLTHGINYHNVEWDYEGVRIIE